MRLRGERSCGTDINAIWVVMGFADIINRATFCDKIFSSTISQ